MSGCGLTRYGIRELAVLTVMLPAGAWLVACTVSPLWLGLALAALPALIWIWVLWFFRDPDRVTPAEDGLLISPADGRVTDITPLGPDSVLGRDGVQIGIFMSVMDVHVNRSPADAVVEKVEHRKGAFLDVRRPQAWKKNESATIYLRCGLAGRELPLVVRQVAGLVARRIVTDLAPGEKIARGQRIGMIKFGSRLEVLAPSELASEVCVRVGQKVRAGSTVLMRAK
jgi:phosphatidylserine decarboxylase